MSSTAKGIFLFGVFLFFQFIFLTSFATLCPQKSKDGYSELVGMFAVQPITATNTGESRTCYQEIHCYYNKKGNNRVDGPHATKEILLGGWNWQLNNPIAWGVSDWAQGKPCGDYKNESRCGVSSCFTKTKG